MHPPRRTTNQARTYTYPQPTDPKSASTPGSIFGRHGGSNLDRRRHRGVHCRSVLANAVTAVGAMDLNRRVAFADEIFAHQPNLLASVLVQQRMGASLQQIDVLLNILFVAYQAMKTFSRRWPVISEATQERCLQRLTGKVLFAEGLGHDLASAGREGPDRRAWRTAVAGVRIRSVARARPAVGSDRGREVPPARCPQARRMHRRHSAVCKGRDTSQKSSPSMTGFAHRLVPTRFDSHDASA